MTPSTAPLARPVRSRRNWGAEHHPVGRAVVLDHLALLEGGGVVLPVDLRELRPAQSGAAVVGVRLLAVDASLQAEAVGGYAQVCRWALGDVGGQVVVEVQGDLAATGLYGDFEVVPQGHGSGGHGVVSSRARILPTPGTFFSFRALAVPLTW